MENDPRVNPNYALDLEKIRRQREVDRAAVESQAISAAEAHAVAWDKAMRRTFKGIVPRPIRHRYLALMMREVDKDA